MVCFSVCLIVGIHFVIIFGIYKHPFLEKHPFNVDIPSLQNSQMQLDNQLTKLKTKWWLR